MIEADAQINDIAFLNYLVVSQYMPNGMHPIIPPIINIAPKFEPSSTVYP